MKKNLRLISSGSMWRENGFSIYTKLTWKWQVRILFLYGICSCVLTSYIWYTANDTLHAKVEKNWCGVILHFDY